MSVLLIAEHNNKELRPFTLNAVTAASQIDADVHALIIGQSCGDAAKALSELPLVKKVIQVEAAHYENFIAENFAPVVVKLANDYSHIICSANTFGKNLMPRIAAALDTSQISDIIKVISPDTFLRPIYAGNAFATVKSKDPKKCITIRPTSFDPCESSGGSAPIEKADAGEEFNQTKFIKREEIKSDRPELGTARVVISGGRGMQSGENFKLITDVADKLGAAIGALTVNFLNTGLVFYALQVHFVQLFTSVLLVIVIVFQTMSRIFDSRQARKSLLETIDERKTALLEKKRTILGK